ncbi:MAG: Maf family nucleotide pyrophosphatase [Bacteroidales bacterium]|nr:Maf family nucleotide pyrophosphatase [Bacteroidales bacterium]
MPNPLDNLSKYEVLLASNSPRRRQLLADLGVNFSTVALPDIDESYPASTPALDVALVVAQAKARAYGSLITSNQLIITADTVVICDGEVMGKPCDDADARRMLRQLAGKTHHVVTGVTISTASRSEAFKAVTEVDFAPLTDDEINFYVETCRPFDKAGAYGIQEWIGCAGISGIRGSFYNVMGLPLHRLYTALAAF